MSTKLPKVMLPLAGVPMVSRVINTAEKLTTKISVVTGYQNEVLESHLRQFHPNVATFYQDKQLGTAHAVMTAKNDIEKNDKVLVLYGDVPLVTENSLKELISLQELNGESMVILTMEPADPTGYGRVLKDQDGHAMTIIEEKDASEEQKEIQEVFTGTMLVNGKMLLDSIDEINNDNAAGEYYLTDLIKLTYNKGVKIKTASVKPEEVLGANNKFELHELERIFRHMNANDLLEQGVTLVDATRVDLRGSLESGQDCSIDINVILEGTNTIGNNVKIGPNVYLKDVVIGDNTVIEAFSHIVSTNIGSDCNIGPYARLREGTEIKDQAKIGNFVETKKTTLEQGAKANHLSYLGDASIGENSNIGAGTITCNYDGKDKHKTDIGNNSFVGTNSSLVAPVKIGDDAYVGAGSVITKDVPDGSLGVARGKQTNKEGWSEKKKK